MDWFSFGLNNITLAAQGCLILSFTGRLTGKKLRPWYFALFLMLLYMGDYVAVSYRSEFFSVAGELLALYGINRLLLKNNCPASWVITVLAVYVPRLSIGVVNSIEMLIFPYVLGHMVLTHILIVLATLLALYLCVLCYRSILKQFSMQDEHGKLYIWMLLPPGLFFFAVELYIFSKDYRGVVTVPYPLDIGKQLVLMGLQLLGLCTMFCTLYVYRRTCDGFAAQSALVSLTQETHAQKTYVAEAQMRYDQTRAFRHDIKNHLSVLGGLMKDGKIEQAQEYLQKLEAVTGELSFPIHTGNPVVDILLRDKLELARANGVETDIALILPKPCGVDDFDLCIIFANALDNAIQACASMDGAKQIHVAGERQGDFYMLEFENTCSVNTLPEMGTGLSNVKAVSEKYGGAMTMEIAASCYRLNILLNISAQPEDSSGQIS